MRFEDIEANIPANDRDCADRLLPAAPSFGRSRVAEWTGTTDEFESESVAGLDRNQWLLSLEYALVRLGAQFAAYQSENIVVD